MADQAAKVFKMLENAPLPKLLESLSMAVVEAQFNIDKFVIEALRLFADKEEYGVELPGQNGKKSMLELGLLPSFYHFQEVNLDIKMALSSMEGEEFSFGAGITAGYPGIFGASINASYSNKYSFSASGSSQIQTKIVSIPPPKILNTLLENYAAKNSE